MALKTTTQTGTTEQALRGLFHSLVGAVVSWPVLTHTLGVSPSRAAEVAALVGGLVFGSNWLHTWLEGRGWLPAMLRNDVVPIVTELEPAWVGPVAQATPAEPATPAQSGATPAA